MRYAPFIIALVAATVGASGCAPRAVSTYPSYERTVARYAAPGDYEGRPLAGKSMCASPGDCDCPRVWYRDQWVYHCDRYWMYWHHGYWYYYPNFHVYYHDGVPHVYRGKTRSIRKTNDSK